MLLAYCGATSCVPGEILRFHLSGEPDGTVAVSNALDGRVLLQDKVSGALWKLVIPAGWPSSVYRARFAPGDFDVYFVVRASRPSSPIVVSIPFATWLAYDRSGVPGEGLYYAEQPDRAARVSFDRPWCGPPPERWEEGLLRWLAPAGYTVDYCSNLDLHDPIDPSYRLLVINGHDEYWSWEMRDSAETFARQGGNIAIFAGNTCYWQARFEDNRRTMVCYRDAVADPVPDRSRVTVEWSSAVVNRPESSLTGMSYRYGAGAWGPYMGMMKETSYTARFGDHWVFDGTGVSDGSSFGLGAVGYETDATPFSECDGVPLADNSDFVILATADLRHWRAYGQGGFATMGIFELGQGKVFNAATVSWGNTLGDPVVERVTRNVLNRLSAPRTGSWETIGSGAEAIAACEHRYFAIDGGVLLTRPAGGQNLRWQAIGDADGTVCLASPSEAAAGLAVGLYAVTSLGALRFREPVAADAPWEDLGIAPQGTVALAICDGTFFAATSTALWALSLAGVAAGDLAWASVEAVTGVVALTAMNGRLYALDSAGNVRTRLPVTEPSGWECFVTAQGFSTIAGHRGRLIASGRGRSLAWYC
jgi:hypothetical protein